MNIKNKKIAVLGAGSWGMGLSKVLAENGNDLLIWTRAEEIDIVNEINQEHRNSRYFKEILFPESIQATTDMEKALDGRDIVLIVIPTVGIRSVAKELNQLIANPKIIVHAAKGLELGSHERISTILEEEIDPNKRKAIVALSGPSHAEEVVVKDLTSVTSASKDLEIAKQIQELFMNDYFRVYRNSDIIGVEIGAALKNIIAVGAGTLKGLGYGDNATAALITRGLAEITRLGVAMGADVETFMGLSGVGDLIVTATSPHSRNWRAGKLIGQGYSIEEIQVEIGMAIEGLSTVIAAKELAEEKGIDMPITNAIYQVVYEEADVKKTILRLMRRESKAE
ncbi:MAG: NAD(P)H-dependent glycerol-3-phosphate dehydrogenase [Atopostipes suicloacalis]|nr:NAD(P)H-dependent glycerol-3-phosphate dehydrogenase [Atopostipes suicloacalis]MDN6730907.1 NAD(P)H-dependent glycerol-3-phosphate dehydrogenase [Atopostipes suicloacalis]